MQIATVRGGRGQDKVPSTRKLISAYCIAKKTQECCTNCNCILSLSTKAHFVTMGMFNTHGKYRADP